MGRYNDKIPNKREIRMRIPNNLTNLALNITNCLYLNPADIYVDDKALGIINHGLKSIKLNIEKIRFFLNEN